MSRSRMPKEILVYVEDYDTQTGKPIYSIAENLDGVPEKCDKEHVGVYALNHVRKFNVKRELS